MYNLSRHKHFLSHILICLLFVIFSVVLMWPINPPTTWDSEIQYGDASIVAYLLSWGAHSLLTDPSQYYNIPVGFPHTQVLAGVDGMIFQALLITPVWALFHNVALVYNTSVYLSFVFCLISAYFASILLIKSRLASMAVAVVFTVTSDRYFHALGHVNLLYTGFIPLVFSFTIDSFRDKNKWTAIASGLTLGLSVYASNYLFVLCILTFILAVLISVVVYRFKISLFIIQKSIVMGVIGVIIAAPVPIIHWKAAENIKVSRADIATACKNEASLPGWLRPPNYLNSVYSRDAALMGLTPEKNQRGEDCQFIGFLVCFCILLESFRLLYQRINRKWNVSDTLSTSVIVAAILLVMASFGPYISILGRQLPGPYLLLFESFLKFTKFFRSPSRLAFISEWLFALAIGIGFLSFLKNTPKCRIFACVGIVFISWFEHCTMLSGVRYVVGNPTVIQKMDEFEPSGKEAAVILPDPQNIGPAVYASTSNWRPFANAWPDNPLLTDYSWFFSNLASDLKSTYTGGLLAQRGIHWVITMTDEAHEHAIHSPYLQQVYSAPPQALFHIQNPDQLLKGKQKQDKERLDYMLNAREETNVQSKIILSRKNNNLESSLGYLTNVSNGSNGIQLIPETEGFVSVEINTPSEIKPILFDEVQVNYTLNKPTSHHVGLYWESNKLSISERTRIAGEIRTVSDASYQATFQLNEHLDWLRQDKLIRLRFDISDIAKNKVDAACIQSIIFSR